MDEGAESLPTITHQAQLPFCAFSRCQSMAAGHAAPGIVVSRNVPLRYFKWVAGGQRCASLGSQRLPLQGAACHRCPDLAQRNLRSVGEAVSFPIPATAAMLLFGRRNAARGWEAGSFPYRSRPTLTATART